jgi:hypothetical protein
VLKPLSKQFLRAIRASGSTHEQLARLAGFPSRWSVAFVVCNGKSRNTPLFIERLHKLAEGIGYDGPVFK